MKIWYDVTDIVNWQSNLTGIQRTTVSILNALLTEGVELELVRFLDGQQRFERLRVAELPHAIRQHLYSPDNKAPAVAVATKAIQATPRPRRRSRSWRLLGTGVESDAVRQSLRELKMAVRQVRRSVREWARARWKWPWHRRHTEKVLESPIQKMASASGGVKAAPADFIATGDAFVSLGAAWCLVHAEAVAQLQKQGVCVARMIYDLIPTLKANWVMPHQVVQITHWVRRTLTQSDIVFTISEFSRSEIVRYCAECRFDVPAITVVRLGDEMSSSVASDLVRSQPRFVPERPFFVCVSTLDVRKNHRLLYNAWTLLAARRGEQCPDLLCIGRQHLFVTDLLREIRTDRVVNRHMHILTEVEDPELEWYYANCQATIYPSKYEGWGLPVAESLQRGRMCLASNATSILEISDLPEFFDPYDTYGLVAHIERVLDDPEWVRQREELIRRTFKPTRWTETATQVLSALRQSTQSGR